MPNQNVDVIVMPRWRLRLERTLGFGLVFVAIALLVTLLWFHDPPNEPRGTAVVAASSFAYGPIQGLEIPPGSTAVHFRARRGIIHVTGRDLTLNLTGRVVDHPYWMEIVISATKSQERR